MDRYYPLELAVPAQTSLSAPLSSQLALENALLVDIEIIIPDGHLGQTGVRVLQSQQQVLPWGNQSWLRGNGYSRIFQVNGEIGARSISVQGYNIDFRVHTFLLRFHLRDLDTAPIAEATPTQRAAQNLVGMTSIIPL
jgi:hypothetical protein